MTPPQTLCDFAKIQYFHAFRWFTLWKVLLYFFGVFVVLFSCTAIVLVTRSSLWQASLTTLGTIVSGAGIAWVVRQRTIAAREVENAFALLKRECSPAGVGFIGIKQQPWFLDLKDWAQKSVWQPGWRPPDED